MSAAEVWAMVLVVYAIGVAITAVMGWSYIDNAADADNKFGARLMILSPIWPLLAVLALWSAVLDLWGMADFKTGRKP